MTESRWQLFLGYLRWLVPAAWLVLLFIGITGVTGNEIDLHWRIVELERQCDPAVAQDRSTREAQFKRMRDEELWTKGYLGLVIISAVALGDRFARRSKKGSDPASS